MCGCRKPVIQGSSTQLEPAPQAPKPAPQPVVTSR